MANNTNSNYYSNPAFCQQSEYYNNYSRERCKSPQSGLNPQRHQYNTRQSPVGAQSPARVNDFPLKSVCESVSPRHRLKPATYSPNEENYEEQDFYEEMLVDDSGFVKQKKIVVVSASGNKNGNVTTRYSAVPQGNKQISKPKPIRQEENGNRYAVITDTEEDFDLQQSHYQKSRYEYLQRRDTNHNPPTPNKKEMYNEEYELGNRRQHRYEVIEVDEETDLVGNNYSNNYNRNDYRYSMVPQHPTNSRYGYVEDIQSMQPDNFQHQRIQQQPQQQYYQYSDNTISQLPSPTSPIHTRKLPQNSYATQKLHELLTTPKKPTVVGSPRYSQTPQKITSPHSPRKPISTISSDPFIVTPDKSAHKIIRERSSKAQQKLNYSLSSPRQITPDKRHTAIVSPMCSTAQSVYSETTFSNKSESWMNLSTKKQPVQTTLTIAATMMLLCGGLTSGLCFYMISVMGKLYYLNFGIVSGFACFVLGLLGCRSRNHYYWLPNRNYMSGYIILTLFSLLTSAGLLVLLFMQPKNGSPLADMTSGAVCGISVLSLILATAGVMTSLCCKMPPPDNRVEHCARGFTI